MFNFLTVALIEEEITKVKGGQFRNVIFISEVKTAAKFKELKVTKKVSANVQIYGTIEDYKTLYLNGVLKSANKILENGKVEEFTISDTYYNHSPKCFSIVEHKTNGKKYLYARFFSSNSIFYVNDIETEKADILQYLTPSDVKKLTTDNSVVYNKTNDILHQNIIRTIKLQNIIKI